MKKLIHNYGIYLLLALFLIVGCTIILVFDGTGERGTGDSIQHYLYAKYALNMPELLLNHWAKPFFTILALPFAQLGITGLKIFNLIISSLTILYTYKTAKKLNLVSPILSGVILFSTPLFFILTFSGLTEPLFALFLILSTYLLVNDKLLSTTILLSFLPFVRSEGLILIGVFAVFLLLKKHWKYLPFLLTGHIIYSVIGSFYYNDILWVFTKIPYAKMSSTYGDGDIFHFTHQLFYVIGAPIYALLVIGLLIFMFRFITIKNHILSPTSVLIVGGFLSFFVAHTLFWYLGIFNSMGLKRVLICVAPQIAIIALIGFNGITENRLLKSNMVKRSIQVILILAVFLFPFTGNKAAINWDKDFGLSPTQKTAIEVSTFINGIQNDNSTFVFSDPYLAELLDINYFDENKRLETSMDNLNNSGQGDIIVWDNWFSVIENGISEAQVNELNHLKKIKTFTTEEGEVVYTISVKK